MVMFQVILGEHAEKLKPDTRAAVIRSGLTELAMALRELPLVAPQMSQVQRNQIRISLCEAIGSLDTVDGIAEGKDPRGDQVRKAYAQGRAS